MGRLRANTLPDDDAQTTFMSRAAVSQMPPSSRRPPVFTEERTRVDFPRPTDDSEDRTIVAPLSFPKTSRATFMMPAPRPSSHLTPTAMKPAPRPSQPPPLPARARSEPPPAVIPPPPPSATRVVIDTPAPVMIPQATPSSPAVVSDVSPDSTVPSARVLLRSREPMILVAAALGVLGMIFTMGIVVGLVFSLHSPETAEASGAPRATAAGVVMAASDLVPVKVAPAKVAAVAGPVDTVVAGHVSAPAPVAAAAPLPVSRLAPAAQVSAPAPRPYRPATVAMATPAPRPAPAAAAKRAKASDPDMDAASAASDLAKAQLEASLR